MKKLNNRFSTKCVIIILSAIALFLFYYFPLQRMLAEKKMDEYMELQGADAAEIEHIEYHKDSKQDGYSIFVTFRDDEYRYVYRYYLLSSVNGEKKYNIMYCDVYNSENMCMDEFAEGMRYRSLEWTK